MPCLTICAQLCNADRPLLSCGPTMIPRFERTKKMGVRKLGRFMSEGNSYVAITWTAEQPNGLTQLN